MIKLFAIVFALAELVSLAACGRDPVLAQAAASSMLEPGDRMGQMILTTGAAQAYQLWSFCSTPVNGNSVTTVTCQAPQVSRLAIGHPFNAAGQALDGLDWPLLAWKLSLDDRPVDLYSFGTYDLVYPGMAEHPSPIREVFRRMEVWDLVLEKPTPGAHTLRGSVQVGDEIYTWIVDLWIGDRNN